MGRTGAFAASPTLAHAVVEGGRLRRRALLLLIALTVGACSSDAPPDEGGRWVSSDEAPYAVRMRTSRGSKSIYCSASKIGPRIFLTARHCAERNVGARLELSRAGEAGITLRIAALAVPPDEANRTLYDVALLAVDTDTPAFATATLHLEPELVEGKRLRAYGFGCDKDRLRELSLDLVSEERFASLVSLEPKGTQAVASLAVFEGPDRACSGDSGGPIVSERGEIVALISAVNIAEPDLTFAFKADEAISTWIETLQAQTSTAAWRDMQVIR